jgi:hypothetical protein
MNNSDYLFALLDYKHPMGFTQKIFLEGGREGPNAHDMAKIDGGL